MANNSTLIQSPAIAKNTVALYKFENNANDSSPNNYNLTVNGTIPYSTSPILPTTGFGQYEAGIFSDSNYFSGPSQLNTKLSNQSSIFTEMFFYLNDISNSPVLTYRVQDGFNWWMQVGADGSIKCQWNSGPFRSSVGVISTGQWYYAATQVNSGPTPCYLYLSPANNISQTPVANSGGMFGSTPLGIINNIIIGRYPAVGYAVNGYIKNFRLSTVIPKNFPTLD